MLKEIDWVPLEPGRWGSQKKSYCNTVDTPKEWVTAQPGTTGEKRFCVGATVWAKRRLDLIADGVDGGTKGIVVFTEMAQVSK